MKSVVAVTMELDDISAASEELISYVKAHLEFQKNSIGILYYDYEMDGSNLSLILMKELSIEIIGCTVLAALEGIRGYVEMGAVLTILTADDCFFSTSLSYPLTTENSTVEIKEVYNRGIQKLNDKPKLIFALPPCSSEVIIDEYVVHLDQVSNHIPIIGGIPSSSDVKDRKIIFNGEHYSDRIVLLLISGNLRPVFTIQNVITSFSDKKCIITKSRGSYVYEVDQGISFLDYMKRFGLSYSELMDDEENVFFKTHPMLLGNMNNTEAVPYVRIINKLDLNDGSACSYAQMPQGASMTLALLRQEDIGESARRGIEEIKDKIIENQSDDYTYYTILCVSCSARHLVLTPYHESEGKWIKEGMPEGINLSGFYSYGEIAPTFYKDGKAENCAHNASITFCAF